MNIAELDAAIKTVCPIRGVNTARVIDFAPEATQEQREAAQAIADAVDFDAPSAIQLRRQSERDLLLAAKKTAAFDAIKSATLPQINTYIDNTFPSLTAQQRNVLKVLTASAGLFLRERD